jgi:hypothetical protein
MQEGGEGSELGVFTSGCLTQCADVGGELGMQQHQAGLVGLDETDWREERKFGEGMVVPASLAPQLGGERLTE